MRLRIGITITAIVLYVGLFSLYIFMFLQWTPFFDKLFYTCITSGAVAFAVIDWKVGFVNSYHKDFNLLLFLCVLTNYLFILLKMFEVFDYKHPQPMFYAFNVTILVISLTIFFNELKYKVMGDDDENTVKKRW